MARDSLDVLCVPTLIEARASRDIDLGRDTIVVWQNGTALFHANTGNRINVELSLVPNATIRPVRVAFRWTTRPREGFVYWKDGGRWIYLAGAYYAFDGHYLTSSRSVWSLK